MSLLFLLTVSRAFISESNESCGIMQYYELLDPGSNAVK